MIILKLNFWWIIKLIVFFKLILNRTSTLSYLNVTAGRVITCGFVSFAEFRLESHDNNRPRNNIGWSRNIKQLMQVSVDIEQLTDAPPSTQQVSPSLAKVVVKYLKRNLIKTTQKCLSEYLDSRNEYSLSD